MDDMYREVILDHYKHPHNAGVLEHPDVSHEDNNPLCGDRIRIDLQIADGIITDARFQGRGCAISQASASILTDELRGMSLDEVRAYDPKTLLEEIGVPIGPARLKCALLSYKVLQGAVIGSEARWPEEADLAVTAGEGGAAP